MGKRMMRFWPTRFIRFVWASWRFMAGMRREYWMGLFPNWSKFNVATKRDLRDRKLGLM